MVEISWINCILRQPRCYPFKNRPQSSFHRMYPPSFNDVQSTKPSTKVKHPDFMFDHTPKNCFVGMFLYFCCKQHLPRLLPSHRHSPAASIGWLGSFPNLSFCRTWWTSSGERLGELEGRLSKRYGPRMISMGDISVTMEVDYIYMYHHIIYTNTHIRSYRILSGPTSKQKKSSSKHRFEHFKAPSRLSIFEHWYLWPFQRLRNFPFQTEPNRRCHWFKLSCTPSWNIIWDLLVLSRGQWSMP